MRRSFLLLHDVWNTGTYFIIKKREIVEQRNNREEWLEWKSSLTCIFHKNKKLT